MKTRGLGKGLPLTHKILDWTNLKALTDDRLNVDQNDGNLCLMGHETSRRKENADYHHFLLFTQCFLTPSS